MRRILAAPFYAIAGAFVVVGMAIGWLAQQIRGTQPVPIFNHEGE